MTDIAALRDAFRRDKAALFDSLSSGPMPAKVLQSALRQLSALVDGVLMQLWQKAGFGPELCLAAVGGFGRAELFPHSDVDVLVLLPDGQSGENTPGLQAQLEAFIGSCWDCGLEIGSSVRTVSECVAESAADITVQTSLLEARRITGHEGLFRRFRKSYSQAMDPLAFMQGKLLEMRQRHTKFEDTPYALEPNCKESPGGLRDLQIIMWVARAAGLGQSWDALVRKGISTNQAQRGAAQPDSRTPAPGGAASRGPPGF